MSDLVTEPRPATGQGWTSSGPLLQVEDLVKHFPVRGGHKRAHP